MFSPHTAGFVEYWLVATYAKLLGEKCHRFRVVSQPGNPFIYCDFGVSS